MIRVRQVKVPLSDKDNIKLYLLRKLKISDNELIDYEIVKESIDARHDNIYYIYEIDASLINEDIILSKGDNDIIIKPDESFRFVISGTKKLENRPVIVGAGPAGLFAGYMLALNGYNPIILERGEKVEDRVKSVEDFFEGKKLNINSNVQFGEGGAGTFSDGKLNTLVKDKLFIGKKVFEILVEHGAPQDILYKKNPHIGTDLLRNVIINIRNSIIKLGGEFRYNTLMTNIICEDNRIKGVILNNKETLNCDILILAIGHSSRDTFKMLYDNNLFMEPKPFAIGVRIEHLQEWINQNQYGKYASLLPPASYKLTYKASNGRGVYSFCMCPGGFVVNASSFNEMLAINGMSNHKRDTKNANSALVVTISPKDYGDHPLDGIKYQQELESKAYHALNGLIPQQLYKDFKNNKISREYGIIKSITKGQTGFYNLNDILPSYVIDSLKEAIEYFGKKIKNYNHDDVVLSAIESRTSSPVRIPRDDNYLSNIYGLYPCGEGAGYAGGITTSAMDGIKVALKIGEMYHN